MADGSSVTDISVEAAAAPRRTVFYRIPESRRLQRRGVMIRASRRTRGFRPPERHRAALGSLIFLVLVPRGGRRAAPVGAHGLGDHIAVASTIVGQALILGRPVLLAYVLAFGAAVIAFVRGYEEPTLAKRYGEQYAAYRRSVPGWWPRRRPWVQEG